MSLTKHVTHTEVCLIVQEKEDSYQWYDIRDQEFDMQRTKLCEQIQCIERGLLFTKSSASSSHRSKARSKSSKGSTRSSSRSVSQAKAEAAAKAAKVKIEMEFLQKENELKLKEKRGLNMVDFTLFDKAFSNSLIIHQAKTKKITTVKEVLIPGLN